MARGYAAVSLLPSLGPVRSVSDVAAGSEVRVTVADGSFDTEVVRVAANPGRKS
jgi:exonuclease VII large subunit